MTAIVLLDSGPLGLLAYAKASPLHQQCKAWHDRLLTSGTRLCIPAIADYEVRRELIRLGLSRGLRRLDRLTASLDFLPISQSAMLRAAALWADVRQRGLTTADDKALDGDVILAAQALELMDLGHNLTVATTNVAHLSLFVPAKLWQDIDP